MQIRLIEFGMFRLDGGAMFGSVPKNLWSKLIPVDAENCIPLASRSVLCTLTEAEDGLDKKILIDVGCGDKWDEKSKSIFAFQNTPRDQLGFQDEEITDVLLTHLHFDHAGGISRWNGDRTATVRQYPNAKIWLQESNFERAQHPSLRERASYLKENWSVIDPQTDQLLTQDGEVFRGITVHRIDGHTLGQQWVEIDVGGKKYLFATDLIPTSRHLPISYHMGYDLCAETVLDEKKEFLEYAAAHDAIIIFQHDPDTPAATVRLNEKGHFVLKDRVAIPR